MQRPIRIKIFGIICLVFGGFILLQNFGQLGAVVAGPDGVQVPPASESKGQMTRTMRDMSLALRDAMQEPVYRIGLGLKAVLGLFMAGVLIAAGGGLLRNQLWSLRLARLWGIFAICSAVFITVLQCVYLVSNIPETTMPRTMVVGMYVGMAFSLFLMCIFPALLIFLLPSRNVIAYLAAQSSDHAPLPAASAPAPPQPRPTHQPARPAPPPPTPPPVSAADQTWRDDPWNDPNSK